MTQEGGSGWDLGTAPSWGKASGPVPLSVALWEIHSPVMQSVAKRQKCEGHRRERGQRSETQSAGLPSRSAVTEKLPGPQGLSSCGPRAWLPGYKTLFKW